MAPEPLQRYILNLKSGSGSSGKASEWARGLAEKAGLDEERIYALDLCIVEMVSNVVDYTYEDGSGEIRIELALGGESAILTIADRGPPFDPLSVPPPTAPASLDDAKLGGYGIHMVRTTADRCHYERRDGLNVFTAWFGA